MVREGLLAQSFAKAQLPFIPGMDITAPLTRWVKALTHSLASPAVRTWSAWWTEALPVR